MELVKYHHGWKLALNLIKPKGFPSDDIGLLPPLVMARLLRFDIAGAWYHASSRGLVERPFRLSPHEIGFSVYDH